MNQYPNRHDIAPGERITHPAFSLVSRQGDAVDLMDANGARFYEVSFGSNQLDVHRHIQDRLPQFVFPATTVTRSELGDYTTRLKVDKGARPLASIFHGSESPSYRWTQVADSIGEMVDKFKHMGYYVSDLDFYQIAIIPSGQLRIIPPYEFSEVERDLFSQAKQQFSMVLPGADIEQINDLAARAVWVN